MRCLIDVVCPRCKASFPHDIDLPSPPVVLKAGIDEDLRLSVESLLRRTSALEGKQLGRQNELADRDNLVQSADRRATAALDALGELRVRIEELEAKMLEAEAQYAARFKNAAVAGKEIPDVTYIVGKEKKRDLTGRAPGDHVTWKDKHGVAHTCLVLAVSSNEPGEPLVRLSMPCREWVQWDSVTPLRRGRL